MQTFVVKTRSSAMLVRVLILSSLLETCLGFHSFVMPSRGNQGTQLLRHKHVLLPMAAKHTRRYRVTAHGVNLRSDNGDG